MNGLTPADATPHDDAPAHAPITRLDDFADFSVLAAPGTQRRQSLAGFDDDYVDIVDYIVRCTHKIWEEGGVGLIYTHYRHNAVIHTPYGLVVGIEDTVKGTLQTQAMLPDRTLYADDVIWKGDDQRGFTTSHLITNVARHTGWGVYGPPTGRRVTYRAIAECVVKANRIGEEWLVRDNLAIVLQLGLDPHAVARSMAENGQPAFMQKPSTGPVARSLGQHAPMWRAQPPGDPQGTGAFDLHDFVREALHEVWNLRRMDRLRDYFAPDYTAYTVPMVEIHGLADYRAWMLTMLGAMPDALHTVEDVYALGNADDGYRVSVRWRIDGTHDGSGVWGPATHKRLWLMGLSHFRVHNGLFTQETTVHDQLALLRQLYL